MIIKRTFSLILYDTDGTVHKQDMTVYMDNKVEKGTDSWTADCQYVISKAVLLLYISGIVQDIKEIEAIGYVGTKPMQLCMRLVHTKYTDDYMLKMMKLVYDVENERVAEYKEERETEKRILDFMIDKLS